MPVAEDSEQVEGTELAEGSPQEAGTWLLRRAVAVRKDAYDQVRSMAERAVPSVRENCSEREPLAGVCACTISR